MEGNCVHIADLEESHQLISKAFSFALEPRGPKTLHFFLSWHGFIVCYFTYAFFFAKVYGF